MSSEKQTSPRQRVGLAFRHTPAGPSFGQLLRRQVSWLVPGQRPLPSRKTVCQWFYGPDDPPSLWMAILTVAGAAAAFHCVPFLSPLVTDTVRPVMNLHAMMMSIKFEGL
ncbi:hypothetical protein GMO_18900 [Gluconobacter morbifer G707]|uniref:Uncharacterized protein n=1 Tax=Gluconobacter morbifer G707 TaxID=1088869 RepID=G6XK74_9PROT|nr:hypothetical protein GMO_18900 [Gluconobacter morbifer G707]